MLDAINPETHENQVREFINALDNIDFTNLISKISEQIIEITDC